MKQDLGPANIRITGFGVDSGTTNQTNQTHVGPNAGSSGTTMRYRTDTTGGNSGSPVIDEATGIAVGIHTHGGCTSSGGNNNGTSFFNSALWNAIDTGTATTFQTGIETFDHNIRTVTLTGFTDPVVVLGPPSFNGTDPSTTRVRNVNFTSFQHNLQEWDYLDGTHGNTDEVGYLALNRGATSLGSLPAEAGTVAINHNWTAVSFTQSFTGAPVVITQVGTFNGGQAVTTRVRSVTASGFEVRLQEEEGNDGTHVVETVHWIAVAPGSTTVGGSTFVAGTQSGVTDAFATVSFGQTLSNPVFLADMQTFAGNNPATLRYRNLGTTSVQVKVEEEQSLDAEVGHVGEVVGFLAISR